MNANDNFKYFRKFFPIVFSKGFIQCLIILLLVVISSCSIEEFTTEESVNLSPISLKANNRVLVVNSADDNDDGSCDDLHCSLREAILEANFRPGSDKITFNIRGKGPHIIMPVNEVLPTISDEVQIINSNKKKIIIDGTNLIGKSCSPQGAGVFREYPGLDFFTGAGQSIVKGLVIRNFCIGISITDIDGLKIIDNSFEDNIGNATLDFLRSNNNLVKKNISIQNEEIGDQFEFLESNGNTIINNYLKGGEDGIELIFSSNDNLIFGNRIEQPFRDGIFLFEGTNNTIKQNIIKDIENASAWGGIIIMGSSQNFIEMNSLKNVTGIGGMIGLVFNSNSNAVRDNKLINAINTNGISILNDSNENKVMNNNFIKINLLGWTTTTPSGPGALSILSSNNNRIKESIFPVGTEICSMILDGTDNQTTPEYDGANFIKGWDKCETLSNKGNISLSSKSDKIGQKFSGINKFKSNPIN